MGSFPIQPQMKLKLSSVGISEMYKSYTSCSYQLSGSGYTSVSLCGLSKADMASLSEQLRVAFIVVSKALTWKPYHLCTSPARRHKIILTQAMFVGKGAQSKTLCVLCFNCLPFLIAILCKLYLTTWNNASEVALM